MMGGGAGSIQDMINRVKANRALLKKRDYFKKRRKDLENTHIPENVISISDESYHYSMQRGKNARQYQKYISSASNILVMLFLIAGILYFIISIY